MRVRVLDNSLYLDNSRLDNSLSGQLAIVGMTLLRD